MGKLNEKNLKTLIKKPPKRHPDGDGLFFRTAGQGKAYWTFRYSLGGKESETSLGPYPEMSLDQARIRHLELRAAVARKIDPVAKRNGKAALLNPTGTPTFGAMAETYLDRKEKRGELGRNPKHRQQWWRTLTGLPASFRDLPIDQIGPQQVFDALDDIWAAKPETASRLRGRIAAVLDFARKPDDTSPNPAAWSGWLKIKLGSAKKLGKIDRKTGQRVARGNHAAMPYAELPSLMMKLSEIDGVAARALRLTILCATRTSETLGAKWEEINFDTATWTLPPSRMKMGKEHLVPLSDAAISILRAQETTRGENPYCFPGRPMRSLSNMSMAMLMRRIGAGAFTVHGMRSAARSWMADQGVPFEVAEAVLAHAVGNAVVAAYQRSTMLERRKPIMNAWADHVTGKTVDNVVSIKGAA